MVDTPGNETTTEVVAVGGSYIDTLETYGDHDWIAINMVAGQSVTIRVQNYGFTNPLYDPNITIWDDSGNDLYFNEDVRPWTPLYDYTAEMSFTADYTGVYYIDIGGWNDGEIGDYIVTVEEYDVLSSLLWGTPVSDSNISVYFAPAGYSAEGYTSEGASAYEIAQFFEAFSAIEAVADVTFTRVFSAAAADFVILIDDNQMGTSLLGFFNPPGEAGEGIGVFNGNAAVWDNFAGGNLEAGGESYYTIIHEVLHGLGLSHPHDHGGISTIFPGVENNWNDYGNFLLNQGVYTLMSYNPGFSSGPVGTSAELLGFSDYGYNGGPMALDIAVLQMLYGANTTTGSGDDIYTLPGVNATGTFYSTIWDTGGIDQVVYSGSLDTVIDLRPATLEFAEGGGGYISAAAGVAGGFTIANGVVIEQAYGGSGQDYIYGNDVDNRLISSRGHDRVYAGDGNDTIRGGTGNDWVWAGDGDDYVHGGRGADRVWLEGGNDTFRDNEVEGANGDDRVFGGTGNDWIRMDAGDDRVWGEAGLDTIYGGAGNDILDGGDDNDYIAGGTGDDTIYGGDGDDELRGAQDNDYIAGGAGNDMIYGGTGNDELRGAAGNDVLDGGDGDDYLKGALGDDTMTGGAGVDTFVFVENGGTDVITDFVVGEDFIELEARLWGGAVLSEAQVLAYADDSTGVVIFDFGGGNTLTVNGATSVNDLSGYLIY